MALCATWLLWRARGAFSFPVILLFAEGTLLGSWSLGFLRFPGLGVHVTDQSLQGLFWEGPVMPWALADPAG